MKRAIVLLVACGHAQGGGGGVNAALAKLGRPPRSKDHGCIQHALDGRIAEIGDFADDRGCGYREVFVG